VDSNKHIIEEIVPQVGHLPELYEDARSEKYKILCVCWCERNVLTFSLVLLNYKQFPETYFM